VERFIELFLTLHTKWAIDLNINTNTVILSEVNTGINLLDFGFGATVS
jgi:hypothetical protein